MQHVVQDHVQRADLTRGGEDRIEDSLAQVLPEGLEPFWPARGLRCADAAALERPTERFPPAPDELLELGCRPELDALHGSAWPHEEGDERIHARRSLACRRVLLEVLRV